MDTTSQLKRSPITVAEATALYGPESLSDLQIIQALLSKESTVDALDLLAAVGSLQALITMGPVELAAQNLSPEEGVRILVLSEIQRRSTRTVNARIYNPRMAGVYLQPKACGLTSERFGIVGLNARNEVILDKILSQGTATATLISPREFYQEALRAGATSAIAWHNHPSGDASPSREDMALTTRLRSAGESLGVPLADHIILGRDTWHSVRTAEGWDRDLAISFDSPAQSEQQP